MKLLKSTAIAFLLASLSATSAFAKDAPSADSRPAKAKVATKKAPAAKKKQDAMSVRHNTGSQTSRAKLRGDLGLDPTAGLRRDGVLGTQLQSRSGRSARMTVFLDKQRTSLRPTQKVKSAKKPTKKSEPVQRFEPGALDFMD